MEDNNSHIWEEEPFLFEELNLHLKHDVIEKFFYEDFAALSLCNRQCHLTCQSLPFRVALRVESIHVTPRNVHVDIREGLTGINWLDISLPPVRLCAQTLFINCDLTSQKCQKILRQFRKCRTTALSLVIKGNALCSSAELSTLLELLRIKNFQSNHFIKEELFNLPIIKEMKILRLNKCGLTDEQLMNMNYHWMECTSNELTDSGINSFIQAWIHGERHLNYCLLRWHPNNVQRDVDVVFAGTDFNHDEVWTPDDEKLLGHLNMEYITKILEENCKPSDVVPIRTVRWNRRYLLLSSLELNEFI